MLRRVLLLIAALVLCSCQWKPVEEGLEPAPESEQKDGSEVMKKLGISVGGNLLTADFEDNSSAEAFASRLAEGSVTVSMSDYGDFEKVGSLGFSLPRNDRSIDTVPGDVILYQGNQITIYYDENSWSFTKLAHIPGATRESVLDFLGSGTVSVTFSLVGE